MKLCNSPPRTTCMYQLARDQAPDEPDNVAQAGAGAPDAFETLCKFLAEHLDPQDLGEAEALLRHFIDQTGTGNLAADVPPPFPGSPALSMDEMQRRVAVAGQINAGKAIARQHLFSQRFPGAARIRNV